MTARTPSRLSRFCRRALPLILDRADGGRVLDTVRSILETECWNSFDRFHQTSRTLARAYAAAGAVADVHTVPTGGPVGSGRWIIREAQDVRAATLDLVRPAGRRFLDYRDNPWHVIQWSAATPRRGVTADLVVINSREKLDACRTRDLAGRIVLTRLDPRRALPFHELARKGAVGVLSDLPVPEHPDAVKWMKFGFGGIDVNHAACRIVGLMISQEQGRELRALIERHGRVTVRARVDVRPHVGGHDVTCGAVLGRSDPQDEVWAIAHNSEPGAVDNASGVAVCVEIARVIEELAAAGDLPRPRRSIRLLNGYECFGFFRYLEDVWRPQPPLAGVCIDSVGAKPSVCDGRLGWHASTPMTAGFVHPLGAVVLRTALRLARPGYRLSLGGFVSTPDTLIADPKYGFPCPYLETDRNGDDSYAAYHSSADTIDLLSERGLAACAAAMAGTLYFLADAASPELDQLAAWETARTLRRLPSGRAKIDAGKAECIRHQHHQTMKRLQRWMWGGDRAAILARLADCEQQVRRAAEKAARPRPRRTKRSPKGACRVPLRTAPLPPLAENLPADAARQLQETRLPRQALYWADGLRPVDDVARMLSAERGEEISVERVARYFEVHAELGYVELVHPSDMVTKRRLIADLKALGVRAGVDLMVHSSLSRIGHVAGGPETVVEALLAVLGPRGTLVMPSFNHDEAYVYNPMTTPTKNGAIPDAMWRRPDAVRSLQPSHPVAAIGPKAEALCRGHLEAGVWAEDSPIGRLIHGGGWVLSIGVGQTSSTAYHVAEVSMGGGCLAPFRRPERLVGPDGVVRTVRGLSWRDGACPVRPRTLGPELDRRGLRRHGKIGEADATLVGAMDVWSVRREQLRPFCPSCVIRPKRSWRTRYPDYLEAHE
jgi:aminoglycoside N3'-acetyltransferase